MVRQERREYLMARRKTITRDHILNAAYEVVSTEGFSGFTARNIASKMKSSTQPIYLEFRNMEELRDAFFVKIEDYMKTDVFDKSVTNDPVIDMTINFVEFARDQKMLYRALFIEDHAGGKMLNKFSFDLFLEKISTHDTYNQLTDEEKETLFISAWITATGLASLASAERIQPTVEEVASIMRLVINSLKRNPDFKITM